MLEELSNIIKENDETGRLDSAFFVESACKKANVLTSFSVTKPFAENMMMSARYMMDGFSDVWATPYKRTYPKLVYRMQAVLDFFNERRYKMTVEQAIMGNLSFKEKMWITLQLFLKPKTFEKVRNFFAGGKPPAEEVHERDNID